MDFPKHNLNIKTIKDNAGNYINLHDGSLIRQNDNGKPINGQ